MSGRLMPPEAIYIALQIASALAAAPAAVRVSIYFSELCPNSPHAYMKKIGLKAKAQSS